MTHYIGRFKVKSRVQARLLRKNNPDSHYCNAFYSFLKEREIQTSMCTAMVSADAKCKVSIGEPGFPIAAVTRGKAVTVGKNEVFKVGGHDISKVSLTPDAIPLHYIPQMNEEGTECNKQSVGEWYTVKVSVKDMPTQGSSAFRRAAELNAALMPQYNSDHFSSRIAK